VDGNWLTTAAEAFDLAQHGGLEAGETEVVAAVRAGAWKTRGRSSALCGGGDGRAARVRQPKQPTNLVEGFPRRVVDRLTQQLIPPVCLHEDQLGVPARHDQAQKREGRLRRERRLAVTIGQPVGVYVPLDVIDA